MSVTLVGTNGISVLTGSNNQVLIQLDESEESFPSFTLPNANCVVSASMASEFHLSVGTLTNDRQALISRKGATSDQELTFILNDVGYDYKLINSGTGAQLFSTALHGKASVNTIFDGSNWSILSYKRLSTGRNEPNFLALGAILDVNPSLTSSMTLSSADVLLIDAIDFALTGTSHPPTFSANGLNGSAALIFSGSTGSGVNATQYLTNTDGSAAFVDFSCTISTWAEWTIFVACKADVTSPTEQSILVLADNSDLTPLIYVYATNTNYVTSVYNDSLSSSNTANLGVVDTDPHIICISANGAGKINGWFDGSHTIVDMNDVRPKTPGTLGLGAGYTTDWKGQFVGKTARVLAFPRQLTDEERTVIQAYLTDLVLS